MNRFAILIVVTGCGTPPAPAPPPAKVATPIAIDAATPAPVAIDAFPCGDVAATIREARHMADLAFMAMDRIGPHLGAIRLLDGVPEPCRAGAWYLGVASLFAYEPDPVTFGTTTIASVEAALAIAVTKPDDVEVLARLAYQSAIGAKPDVSTDACARVTKIATPSQADAVAYVCGHEAIAAGKGAEASALLATIKDRGAWLDTDLAAARAAKLGGDKAATTKFAKAAAESSETSAHFAAVPPSDVKLVVAAAKALLAK